jgi:YidC/Oxa1 family membrane protein insertase
MHSEKRFYIWIALSLAIWLGGITIYTYLFPRKPQPEPVVEAGDEAGEKLVGPVKPADGEAAIDKPAPEKGVAPTTELAEVAEIDPGLLVLGGTDDPSDAGYRLKVYVSQKGAGISQIDSARFKAESADFKAAKTPLELIQPDPAHVASFAVSIPYDAEGLLRKSAKSIEGKRLYQLVNAREDVVAYVELPGDWNVANYLEEQVGIRGESRTVDLEGAEATVLSQVRRIDLVERTAVDHRHWEVVPGADGAFVRAISESGREVGQEISLRTQIDEPPATITKTYRLRRNSDIVEMSIAFQSRGEKAQAITYSVAGPHKIPIEGEWFTSIFRDVFIAMREGNGTKIETRTADQVAKAGAPERFQALPLQFAGVENQYFAVSFGPDGMPKDPSLRWDAETYPTVIESDERSPHKADVSVAMRSKPVVVEAGEERVFQYKIFAGPKVIANLQVAGAEELATFRKGQLPILGPIGSTLARWVIAPLLQKIYELTAAVSRTFGGTRGNYGIAIILLTVCVRLCLFPLSRKQAIMAKKMQEIQPLVNELKEKYKDDKEKFTREWMDLQRRHNVNMFGGCLPALIQLPIFIGLWQALNNSVSLRQAPFIFWIQNLAAPDMLFRIPIRIPLVTDLLGPYLNVLPLFSMCQMMFQMKLFTPPATTEEQRMQQQMMKYMMFGMGFMFYKVPAGLCLYFITSSGWAIAERLLLPKTFKIKPIEPGDTMEPLPDATPPKSSSRRSGPNGDSNGEKSGWRDQFKEQWSKLQEQADHSRTHRNIEPEKPARPKRPPGPPTGRPKRPRG